MKEKAYLMLLKAGINFLKRKYKSRICCEDGSTDGTKELISELMQKYPISDQSSDERRGYGGGVTIGIKSSKYDYILCIDSDGQCMPNSFMKFYNCEEEQILLLEIEIQEETQN